MPPMNDALTKRQLPQCETQEVVAQTDVFTVESLHLVFANGAERNFERLKSRVGGAVMMVPMIDDKHVLLVREYAAGTERYELGFPKGIVEAGESYFEAASRELKEEVGMGARECHHLKALSSSPAYFGMMVDIMLLWDLYVERLPGDEPEPLEVVTWPIAKLNELLTRDDFTEARSIAAILLLQLHLNDKDK